MSLRLSGRAAALRRTEIREIFDAAPPDAIQLGLGQPDLVTPPAGALGGIAAIAAGRTGYGATAGSPELRDVLAERHGAEADQVLVTVGSQEAMFLACLALCDPGDEVLYPDPGYPAYPVVAGLVGARGVGYPVRGQAGFRVQADDVLDRITARTRAVILCGPSNPTGAIPDREQLERLVDGLGSRGVPWISDEIYAAFDWCGRFRSPRALRPDGGLVISSASKDVSMAGWRVGWVVGPRAVMPRLVAAHQYIVTCAPTISQAAAAAALGARGAAAREEIVERFRGRRRTMGAALGTVPGVRFVEPDGAFYYFADVSEHGDSREVARRILDRCNVVTIPGEAFGPGGAGYLRISFAASRATIQEGIGRIAREMAG